jgi:hypothetical protein
VSEVGVSPNREIGFVPFVRACVHTRTERHPLYASFRHGIRAPFPLVAAAGLEAVGTAVGGVVGVAVGVGTVVGEAVGPPNLLSRLRHAMDTKYAPQNGLRRLLTLLPA